MNAPREDLIRGLAPVRSADDGKTMIGYPIVYDQWTEIHSWEGDFRERIRPGAADRSIKQRKDQIKVQYNHGMHPVVGTSGLGRPKTIRSEKNGVYSETPLSDTSYNRDIIMPQLRDGTLDGMSFRFAVVREEWHDPKSATKDNPDRLPERSITELKLYEFGPVDWPAYEATQVGIRSAAGLSKWLNAPDEERSQYLSRFGIAAEPPRLYVPGFSVPRATADTQETTESADTGTSGHAGSADTGTSELHSKKHQRRAEKVEAALAKGREVRGEGCA